MVAWLLILASVYEGSLTESLARWPRGRSLASIYEGLLDGRIFASIYEDLVVELSSRRLGLTTPPRSPHPGARSLQPQEPITQTSPPHHPSPQRHPHSTLTKHHPPNTSSSQHLILSPPKSTTRKHGRHCIRLCDAESSASKLVPMLGEGLLARTQKRLVRYRCNVLAAGAGF